MDARERVVEYENNKEEENRNWELCKRKERDKEIKCQLTVRNKNS